MSQSSLSIVLEFARTDTPEEPYAFRFGAQSYALRTPQGGRKRVQLDWTAELLGDLDDLQKPGCDPAVIQRVAHVLRGFLEPAGWHWLARDIVEAVHGGGTVDVTVRSAAAELYCLPWELLPLEGSGQCVGEMPEVLVRHEWPETRTVPAAPSVVPSRGRVLVAWSDAGGPVPSAEHIAAIAAACQSSRRPFDSTRDVIARASVATLTDALDRATQEGRPATALHLLCHGGQAGTTSGLTLDCETNAARAVVVEPWRMRQLLAPYVSDLRMVVLMACDSARAGRYDSTAQALHRTGFHVVIASRYPLSVAGSVQITEVLYDRMLVRRASVERAFLEARTRLARNVSHLDWASLQFFAREQDGGETHVLSRARTAPSPPAPNSQGRISGRLRAITSPGVDPDEPPPDIRDLDLDGLIALREQIDSELSSRFEHTLALVHSDIMRSTALFARLGSRAAQRLQQDYRELFEEPAKLEGGRIYAATGDGLQVCFPSVKSAIKATVAFFDAIARFNYEASRESQLVVRAAVHHGPVLTCGKTVHGDGVELTRTIAHGAGSSEIHLSHPAFGQASPTILTHCHALPSLDLSGGRLVGRYDLRWRREALLPLAVVNDDTDEEIPLPRVDTISFGRLSELADGTRANDIVLDHPDASVKRAISRWHFELRRTSEGYQLRQISGQLTEVNGARVAKGDEAVVRPGTVVRIANRLTLRFTGKDAGTLMGAETAMHTASAE